MEVEGGVHSKKFSLLELAKEIQILALEASFDVYLDCLFDILEIKYVLVSFLISHSVLSNDNKL